ncbi:MAG TPA: copper resistance protein NlpE N-terminal domain-containing protein [Burkholderiales bacterium]|jgi:hypothetical protein|nr:copper resistance protein NlpE N-terminal domain-containing protein [Burkholderiales bacterium]
MSRLAAVAATALAAACATPDIPGTYEAILPAASGGGERHVRVTLRADGTAAVSSALSQRPDRFLVEGTWEGTGRRIALTLDDRKTMAFELAGDQLVARDWDRAAWGEPDPGVLTRVWRQ